MSEANAVVVFLMGCLAACGHGGGSSGLPTVIGADPSVRASSLQQCRGACHYGEACDITAYDDDPFFCPNGCEHEQTGDLRCHRVCEDDGLCASSERCVSRPIRVSDTPTEFLGLCVCDGDCEQPGPTNEGGIAAFRHETPLPVDLYYHAATAGDGYVFVSGGLTISSIEGSGASLARVPRIFMARIGEDGRLGQWNEGRALPEALVKHAMVVSRHRLYVVGGESDLGSFQSWISAARYGRPRLDTTGRSARYDQRLNFLWGERGIASSMPAII